MIPQSDLTNPPSDLDLARFFADMGNLLALADPIGRAIDLRDVEQFFDDAATVIELARRRQQEMDRTQAGRFNVFDLIEPDENRLSDIIADLLDPDGRHGQGSVFLSLLFEELSSKIGHDSSTRAKIVREAPTLGIQKFRRRIDILVETDVLLAIENKIDSPEQWEQVKDYLEYLRVHSRNWRTPAFLIYLTPNGRRPSSVVGTELADHQANHRLVCWSYDRELRKWLDRCSAECRADKIRHFLIDLIAYIDSVLKRRAEPAEPEDA
ncbi:MAG: PD-(D/E)XK nuclease family protein [Zavarzinella sp.]|nr:PD-(D/E)XK nuclease family protein [Zavarzinella sp.]